MTDLWHFAKIFSDDSGSRRRERVFSHSSEKHSPPFYCDRPPTGDARHDRGLLFSPGLMSRSHRQRDKMKKANAHVTHQVKGKREPQL